MYALYTIIDNIRQDSSVDVCTPNSPPLESNSTSRTFRGNWRSVVFIPQDQRAVQPRPSETHGPGGRNRLLTASTGEGSEQTQRGRGRSQGIAPSSHTVDSPNPLTVAPRKRRPGQSIYKAPGQERQSNFRSVIPLCLKACGYNFCASEEVCMNIGMY